MSDLEICYAVKDEEGNYFDGVWKRELRYARLYRQRRYAEQIVKRFSHKNPYIIKVKVEDLGSEEGVIL